MSVAIHHLRHRMYYRKDDPTAILPQCAARLTTALRGLLTLLLERADGQRFLVSTDIPVGVPPCARRQLHVWEWLFVKNEDRCFLRPEGRHPSDPLHFEPMDE